MRDAAFELERRLARLGRLRARGGAYGQPASHSDIRALRGMLRDRVEGELASDEAAVAVQEASPHSIWSLYSERGLEGGVAFLPLNTLGVYRLIYGRLNPVDPGIEVLAVRSERPAVLYVWGVVSRPRGLLGLADVLRHLESPRFRGVDVWACPATERGARFAERLGMSRVNHGGRDYFRLSRAA